MYTPREMEDHIVGAYVINVVMQLLACLSLWWRNGPLKHFVWFQCLSTFSSYKKMVECSHILKIKSTLHSERYHQLLRSLVGYPYGVHVRVTVYWGQHKLRHYLPWRLLHGDIIRYKTSCMHPPTH